MLIISKDIPSFALSSELDNFIIDTDKTVQFMLLVGGVPIWSAVYTPDSYNKVRIYDIFSILETLFADTTLKEFSYIVSASGEATITKSFVVLLCRFAMDCSAEYFTHNYYLTALGNRDKETYIGRKEYLYLTGGHISGSTGLISVNADCYYVSNDSKAATLSQTVHLGNVSANGVQRIVVSPSQFLKAGHTLLRYTIRAGARSLTFRVGSDPSDSRGIEFINSFGLAETFYFNGLVEVESEFERSSGYFGGVRRNYHIGEKRVYRANSGYLPTSMVRLAEDLARSRDLSVMGDRGALTPIIITESSAKHSNRHDELFSLSLTFIPAERDAIPYPLLPNIFDDTFDESYN